jgi:hypothetical protein
MAEEEVGGGCGGGTGATWREDLEEDKGGEEEIELTEEVEEGPVAWVITIFRLLIAALAGGGSSSSLRLVDC